MSSQTSLSILDSRTKSKVPDLPITGNSSTGSTTTRILQTIGMTLERIMKKSEDMSRRDLVKSGGVALAATIGAVAAGTAVSGPETEAAVATKRLAMVIDLSRCSGCQACVVACKAEHSVRLGVFRSWVSKKETGGYPAVKRRFLPRMCNHCKNPACLDVCPTGATYKRDDGLVAIDKSKCIGCRHCMGACPYNARYFNTDHDPETEQLFPATTHGTVDKCDFCARRVDNGIVPACVNTCPMSARIFGDLNDPTNTITQLRASATTTTLLPELGTAPSVFYAGGHPDAFRE